MADEPGRLPPWMTWQQRPFPDTNLLLLPAEDSDSPARDRRHQRRPHTARCLPLSA